MAISRRYRPLLLVSVVVAGVVAAKFAVHALGWEVFSINALFSGVVAANVFLMGFLLSGVLADFKESERIPGELAASLESLTQDVCGIRMVKPEADAAPCLGLLARLSGDMLRWLYKRVATADLLDTVNELTPLFAALEPWSQGTLIGRLKQEQSSLRRLIIRVDTIRETSFVSSGYLLADVVTVFVCIGLLLGRMEPFYESLFFVAIISYFMVFLLVLIRDLDNPFGYYERTSGEDVSLEPLIAAANRLAGVARAEAASPAHGSAEAATTSVPSRGGLAMRVERS